MNKEKLNEIMNCECLQSIIENDNEKYSMEEERFGEKNIFTSNSNTIIFECVTSYNHKQFDSKKQIVKDKNEKNYCGIPFLFCPICGVKTKINIPKNNFYAQFQK